MKVAVVGSGVAGLAAAWNLARNGVEVSLYEKDEHIGGHAWTINVEPNLPVDVGFMVFNSVTYPNLISFFEELDVAIEQSDMSFAVSLNMGKGCEWGSGGLSGLFAQKINAMSPGFLYMIREMLLFKQDVLDYLAGVESRRNNSTQVETLGAFLDSKGYSVMFRNCYLLPVCASIWSCGAEGVLGFSAYSVLSFLKNHHMLQLIGRPQWLTVKERSEAYVSKVLEALEARGARVFSNTAVTEVHTTKTGVIVVDDSGQSLPFDHCILATHAPDSLNILGQEATADERRILGAFQYSTSDISLHRDPSFMPRRKAAWSSWNFQGQHNGRVCVTYWLNKLQNLGDTGAPVLVTLNPGVEPKGQVRKWSTSHPIPSPAAKIAGDQIESIQGKRGIWFAGAYLGYGFHEDGFKAGISVSRSILGDASSLLPLIPHMAPSMTWLQYAARLSVITFLRSFVKLGSLQIHEAGGSVLDFGPRKPSQGSANDRCRILVKSPDFYWKVATRADLGLADSFIDGDFTCLDPPRPENGGRERQGIGMLDLLMMIIQNRDSSRVPGTPPPKSRGWWSPIMVTAVVWSGYNYLRHFLRANTLTKARRNIADHYDLSNEMFSTFLDESMTYSCAVFKDPGEDLVSAQTQKLRRMIQKARIASHHHVLEIGFGWGSMALEVVRLTGCKYTGISLSHKQLEMAKKRVKEANLEHKIELFLMDYRELKGVGKYDRIISCEMLEAVGHEYLGDFFSNCDRLLKMDGIMVVQVITTPEERYEEYRLSSDFIKEYIFPGCCVPAFTALTTAMAASSTFVVEHMENIGPHYTETLLKWRENFMANRSEILRLGFGDKFVRMWDYYFVYCAAGFKSCTLGDIQIVFTRSGNMANVGDPYNLICKISED